eukprot:Ihof_evm15s31 gene=Ihof_evmTU15s31
MGKTILLLAALMSTVMAQHPTPLAETVAYNRQTLPRTVHAPITTPMNAMQSTAPYEHAGKEGKDITDKQTTCHGCCRKDIVGEGLGRKRRRRNKDDVSIEGGEVDDEAVEKDAMQLEEGLEENREDETVLDDNDAIAEKGSSAATMAMEAAYWSPGSMRCLGSALTRTYMECTRNYNPIENPINVDGTTRSANGRWKRLRFPARWRCVVDGSRALQGKGSPSSPYYQRVMGLYVEDPQKGNASCDKGQHSCSERAKCIYSQDETAVCRCRSGYIGDGHNCIDENSGFETPPILLIKGDPVQAVSIGSPCPANQNPCHSHASCTIGSLAFQPIDPNQSPAVSCKCDIGYSGDGFQCKNINECEQRLPNPCKEINYSNDEDSNNNNNGAASVCIDTAGSFECRCNNNDGQSYIWDSFKRQCVDLDECSDGKYNDCSPFSRCINTVGLGTFCDDINECQSDTPVCEQNFTCKNTQGSYRCECDSGYQSLSGECDYKSLQNEKDHVSLGHSEICSSNAQRICEQRNAWCVGTSLLDAKCQCKAGYEAVRGDDGTRLMCVNVNECQEGTNQCDKVGGLCRDTTGSYQCVCRGDVQNRKDINCIVELSTPFEVINTIGEVPITHLKKSQMIVSDTLITTTRVLEPAPSVTIISDQIVDINTTVAAPTPILSTHPHLHSHSLHLPLSNMTTAAFPNFLTSTSYSTAKTTPTHISAVMSTSTIIPTLHNSIRASITNTTSMIDSIASITVTTDVFIDDILIAPPRIKISTMESTTASITTDVIFTNTFNNITKNTTATIQPLPSDDVFIAPPTSINIFTMESTIASITTDVFIDDVLIAPPRIKISTMESTTASITTDVIVTNTFNDVTKNTTATIQPLPSDDVFIAPTSINVSTMESTTPSITTDVIITNTFNDITNNTITTIQLLPSTHLDETIAINPPISEKQCMINFESAFAKLGNRGDPTDYYTNYGVTFGNGNLYGLVNTALDDGN